VGFKQEAGRERVFSLIAEDLTRLPDFCPERAPTLLAYVSNYYKCPGYDSGPRQA
jgi:hypothetical protein